MGLKTDLTTNWMTLEFFVTVGFASSFSYPYELRSASFAQIYSSFDEKLSFWLLAWGVFSPVFQICLIFFSHRFSIIVDKL